MKRISLDGNWLLFEGGRIDLRCALKIKMYNMLETREYWVSGV